MLSDITCMKLSEQFLPDQLQNFADALWSDEMLIQDILLHHRVKFSELCTPTKQQKQNDQFVL